MLFSNKANSISIPKIRLLDTNTPIRDDVKRSSIHNISKNSNQIQVKPKDKESVQFGLGTRQIRSNLMQTVLLPSPPPPPPPPYVPTVDPEYIPPSRLPRIMYVPVLNTYVPQPPPSKAKVAHILSLLPASQEEIKGTTTASSEQVEIRRNIMKLLLQFPTEELEPEPQPEPEPEPEPSLLQPPPPIDLEHSLKLPFDHLQTENTNVIIDSEPNSPRRYAYNFENDPKPLTSSEIEQLQKWVDSTLDALTLNTTIISRSDIICMIKAEMKKMEFQQEMNLMEMGSKIESMVETYLSQMIMNDSKVLLENPSDEEDEGAKTKFEEMIEPAVARIVQRIIKYDYAQEKNLFPSEDVETSSVNLDINYDEVYDYELQEQGQFVAPQSEIKPGMNNPMFDSSNTTAEIDSTMASIYKKEDTNIKKYFENELRTVVKSSRKWQRFANGIETGNVIDMVLDKLNKKIFIVGHFKHVNRIPIENIACYDMTEKTWGHVGHGIPSVATCVAVYEEAQIVFVGGVFGKVGKDVEAQNIAAYYVLEDKWVPLGEGLNRDCNTIVFDKKHKKLYAGGTFTKTGSQSMHYVGIYDLDSNTWCGLYGGEINGPCRTLLKPNDTDLYIGGLFTHAGNADIHASYVAKYNIEKQEWSDLSGGLQGYCNALAYDVSEDVVYVGGTFNSVGNRESSLDAHHIAKYNIANQSWDIMNGGVNNVVNSLSFDDVDHCLYVGGTFTHTYEEDVLLNRIGRYCPDQNKWSSLANHFQNSKKPVDDEGNDHVGLNGVCRVMNMDDKSLFVAGSFQIAGSITANSIVRYVVNRG